MSRNRKRTLINRFFNHLNQRNFTEAERQLERIKKRTNTDTKRGYLNALEGMLIALKSNDQRYAFISRIEEEKISNFKKEFTKQSKDPFFTDFDKGFFTAWADYMKIIDKR
jgi:hypothetical protein